MCGIAGWLGHTDAAPGVVDEIAAALRHRGPDAQATLTFDDAALVHTRLRILDLTEAGAQPMPGSDESTWVVFNGEIYNHHELRRELERAGYVFRGRSDTEVIPYLYERHGLGFVERLHGMFAVAVLDLRRRRLVLARDRFGIKPLFYGRTSSSVAFASELPALRMVPGLDLDPDAQAIHDFVALHVVPAPSTVHRGIRSLEPGQLVVADASGSDIGVDVRRYHNWTVAPDPSLSLEAASETAAGLLDRAVGGQIESDVPLGSLLSGGIDSSLVSDSANRASGGRLSTFGVGFDDPAFDESRAIEVAADGLGTDHRMLGFGEISPSWDEVAALLTHAGQPFADTSVLAVHQLALLVREHVTVALSGDGGDEGFGGYGHFRRVRPLAATLALPAVLRRPLLGLAAPVVDRVARLAGRQRNLATRVRDAALATTPVAMLSDVASWSRPAEMERLWVGPVVEPVERLFEPQWRHELPKRAGAVERMSAMQTEISTRVRMANDYLPKIDIASMRASLEVRVPMLDEDLFAFGLTLPHRLKWRGKQGKRVLREVAERRVPTIARLPKHGFGVPFDSWVDDAFRARLRDEVLGHGSPVADVIDVAACRTWLDAFDARRVPDGLTRQGLYQRIFMLMALHVSLDGGRS